VSKKWAWGWEGTSRSEGQRASKTYTSKPVARCAGGLHAWSKFNEHGWSKFSERQHTEGFTQYLFPNLFAEFHTEYPQTRFVLRSGTPSQVEHWVAIGDVDLGITFSTASSTAVSVEFSANAPVCALMNPTHPLALKDVLTLDDLLDYPIAVLEKRTTVRQLIDWCCSVRGIRLEPTLTTNNSSAMHQFSAQTKAITLGSQVVLKGMLGKPSLVARNIDEPFLNQRQLQIIVMKERRLPPTVYRFLTTLKKALTL
jgi:DNA-binding transcriptional LysR family regulator